MGVARAIPAGTLVVAVWFSWTHVAVASAQGNQIDSNRDTLVTPTVERLKNQSGFFDSQGKPNFVTVRGDAQNAFGGKGAVVKPPKRPLRPPGTLGAIPTPKHADISPWMIGGSDHRRR